MGGSDGLAAGLTSPASQAREPLLPAPDGYGSSKMPPKHRLPSDAALAALPRIISSPRGEFAPLLCGLSSSALDAGGKDTPSSSTGDMKPEPGLVRSLTASILPLGPSRAALALKAGIPSALSLDFPWPSSCAGNFNLTKGWPMKSWLPIRKDGFLMSKDRKNSCPALDTLSAALPSKTSSFFSMLARSCIGLSPLNGGLPISSSYMMAPTDHISALQSYSSCRKISGAMYNGEPQTVSAISCGCRARAKPKSAIFKTGAPSPLLKSMFCGFKSRWMTFSRCKT
mmetsp:Transcript_54687/g.127923  ORF Transcript_54687/g.127923 Transcript_54687/m.127923 type:complete len:284 (-) Transcript_54687:419-1270(-)